MSLHKEIKMGRFTNIFKGAPVESPTLSRPPLETLDLATAASEIRDALEAGQLSRADELATLRNRASDLQKGYPDSGGSFGASSESAIACLFDSEGVFPPGLSTADCKDILVAVALNMLWCGEGVKNVEGVLLGADPNDLMTWNEIELERSLDHGSMDFTLAEDLEVAGLKDLSTPARQLLAHSGSKGDRATKDPELLRRQVCLSPKRFQVALEELRVRGLAGTGDFAATLGSYTTAELIKIAELADRKIPKSGRKARQVEALLDGVNETTIRELAGQINARKLSNDWWILLPQSKESATAKLLGGSVFHFLLSRTFSALSATEGAWEWATEEGCCSLCKKLEGKHKHGDPVPKAHLSCRCCVLPVVEFEF